MTIETTAKPINPITKSPAKVPENWLNINQVQVVVNDDLAYDNPLYAELLFDKSTILVTESVKTKDGKVIYDTIINKGVDGSNNPITFETYKPRQTQVKKEIRTKRNRFIVNIKDIRIKESQLSDYFNANPIIYYKDLALNVLEYEGWLPQVIDKTESSQSNTTKITIKTFIK